MNIALIAHDKKKELMVQICIAYCGILAKHNIFATETTGKLVAEATGLKVHRFLSGAQGGDQQGRRHTDKNIFNIGHPSTAFPVAGSRAKIQGVSRRSNQQ